MKFEKKNCLKYLHFGFDINRSLNCYFWPILLKRLTIDQLLIFTFMEEFLGELDNFFSCMFYTMFHCIWVWFPSSVIFTNGTLIEVCISAFLISYFGQPYAWDELITSYSFQFTPCFQMKLFETKF